VQQVRRFPAMYWPFILLPWYEWFFLSKFFMLPYEDEKVV